VPVLPLPPPLQARTALERVTRRVSIPSMDCQPRRLLGFPKRSMQASVAPPAVYQGTPCSLGWRRAALVAAVVEMVRVAVLAEVPEMLAGLVDPKLNVGSSWPPAGLEVMDAVSAMLPVKPPLGVTVMDEVFPVVAPGARVTDVPAIVKDGWAGGVTVTVAEFEAL
jgi:hypothetical protein